MDSIAGAKIWCGHGVLAHNLVKISGLVEAKQSGWACGDHRQHYCFWARVSYYRP